ncbi:hypothetical protein Aperf_G00000011613 [Anoplocephala perfoliata]
MLEVANKERLFADTVAQRIVWTRNQRLERLQAKIDQVRKLKELELQKLAQDGYRKQTTCDRDIYRPVLNKLYIQDLKAQIEMNKKIKTCEKLREDALPSDKSLPIGLDTELHENKRERDLKEDLKICMSAREARQAAMAEQKLMEAMEARDAEKLYLKDKEEAERRALEKKMSLRNMFEQQIADRTKELKRQKEEEARTSAWLISNAIQQDAAFATRSQQNRMLAKRRADEYLEYVKRVQKEKEINERARERAVDKVAAKMTEMSDAKRRQLSEASSALEKEVREAQIKRMLEKERPNEEEKFSGGISFLDKIFTENDKAVERTRQTRELITRELKQQIQRRPATVQSTDWGSNGRDLTRPFRLSVGGDFPAYEYLNPARKIF